MADYFRIGRVDGIARITDPLAFSEAGRTYAVATAGAAPAIDLETSEDDSATDGEEDGEPVAGDASPALPHGPPRFPSANGPNGGERRRKADD